MTPFHGMADPVGAALLRAAIADRTAPGRVPRFVADDDPAIDRDADGALLHDGRRRDQRAYDVLIGLLTAGVRSDREGTGPLHATATVQVVVTASDLESGVGLAWLDDVAEPISARTAAEIACDGGIAVTVVDDTGRPLFQGRRMRFFTAALRRALAVRGRLPTADGRRAPSAARTALGRSRTAVAIRRPPTLAHADAGGVTPGARRLGAP